MKKKAKKLLLVGWDAADWKVINPLMDKGLMPTLEKLVNKGVIGNIATLDPPLSPMLWTSIGTGKTADKHGILNFVEPHPEKLAIRPVTSTSRKVKAFWNILNQEGYKCNIVGWWPSNPAEPINGSMVSNLYAKAVGNIKTEWPMKNGTVHPESLNELFASFRIHPEEITTSHLLPFVPKFKEIIQQENREDRLVEKLCSLIAEASTVHNAATWLMENTEWDVTAVYYDAIDVTCHNFMKFHPPQMPGIPNDYFDWYKDVVSGMYRFHDMMLERLLDLAGEDTTVILMSDHGFHSDHLRPKFLPKEPDAPALEHRTFGVLCMKGPGIKQDERVYGATLLDITPTILNLFGLPAGQDMDGKVLTSIFEETPSLETIPSWETVEGNSGMHEHGVQDDPYAAQEALQQLVELGYIEAPGPDMEKNIRKIIELSNYNLAKVYMNRRKYADALPLLEKLHTENPDVPRYGFTYASCLHREKKLEECRNVIQKLKYVEKRESPQLDLLEASLLFSEKKPHKALEILRNAENKVAHMASFHLQLGSIYNSIQQWEDALRAFSKSLEIDPEQPTALTGRGFAHLRMDHIEEAIEDLLDGVGLLYHLPLAHYLLGEALFKYNDMEKSAQAFEVCIGMEPGFRRAYAWLVKIYTEKLNDPVKAAYYKNIVDTKITGNIVVVSGLPRSGTSMMMQMLEAGGMEILNDKLRQEDSNNPKGYYEYEPIKKLASNNECIQEANGKAVKIITQLLQYLPHKFNYKIIHMNRDLGEIMRSQQIMLGKPGTDLNLTVAQTFEKQVEKAQAWLKSQPHIEVLNVDYSDVVKSPRMAAETVSAFIGTELNIEKMVQAVDGTLYRNRSTKQVV